MKGWALYVAVDDATGKPLRVETRKSGRVTSSLDVKRIAEASDLPRYLLPAPVMNPPLLPGRRSGRGGAEVTLAEAARLLPGALWAGRTIAGQPFRRARAIRLKDGHKQIELLYGDACPAHCILVKQGLVAGWAPGIATYRAVPDQSILVRGGRMGEGRAGGVKIRIEGTSRAAVIAAARALRPLRP